MAQKNTPASKPASVEVIAIGREILDGRVIDTNSTHIAEILRPLGLVARFGQRVDDQVARIVESFEIAARRAQVVLVTGGLGPTSDDLTAEAFGKFLGEGVALNREALAQIEARFSALKLPFTEPQKKQAMLPPSCFVVENKIGSAPGFGLERDGILWFFMPGVPQEMIKMLREQIAPRLPKRPRPLAMTWATQFTSEGSLQGLLTPVERKLASGFEITYRTRFPENHIGLYADCASESDETLFRELSSEITQILGNDVFTTATNDEKLRELEEVVVDSLKSKHFILSAIESCTGGLIANRITNVSGSSSVFWGATVVYDNSMKQTQLNIPAEILSTHGAVSRETARLLAEEGLRKMQNAVTTTRSNVMSDRNGFICVSTTGIAGPTGGSAEKPVGLCFIGLAMTGKPTVVEEVRGRSNLDRLKNKSLFSQKALELIRKHSS